jgi:SAM-dependent methyltransferase
MHDAVMTEQPGRTHEHGRHDQLDWSVRGQQLVSEGEVTAPMVDQALGWLAEHVPGARDVLDIGSGPGVTACRFAQLWPAARVLAADGAAPLLALARTRAIRLGIDDRFITRQVSLPDDLADLPKADLVWVSGVVHHLPDPVAVLRSLGTLVRPGGLLAIREGGLTARFLPDGVAPGLLPRLEATAEELVAASEHPAGVLPHHGGWPDLLRTAGLQPVGSRSFLLDLPAPVSPEVRQYLHGRLATMGEMLGDRITAADQATLAGLIDPESPDSVLWRPDVFLLSASTVHLAQPSPMSALRTGLGR